MPARDRTGAALAGAFVVFVAAGFFLPSWAVSLVILSLARGIVALGLVVQFRSGLVSFGQALFFAIGGYAVGLAGLKLRLTDMIVLTVIGVAAATLLGAGLGFLMRRYREIFFAMLSLGFSMLFYGLLVKTETLGSTDGFDDVWSAVAQKLLTSYTDKPYISDAYARELSSARTQAIAVERVSDDPPGSSTSSTSSARRWPEAPAR